MESNDGVIISHSSIGVIVEHLRNYSLCRILRAPKLRDWKGDQFTSTAVRRDLAMGREYRYLTMASDGRPGLRNPSLDSCSDNETSPWEILLVG